MIRVRAGFAGLPVNEDLMVFCVLSFAKPDIARVQRSAAGLLVAAC